MPPSSEPDWWTQDRYGSVINTGSVTDDCFSSLSPICILTNALLYSHMQENSEKQNGRNIGSRKQAPQNSLVSSLVLQTIKSNHRLTSSGFCLFWTMDHRKRLALNATTTGGPSALDLANARKSSVHSSFRRTTIKELCSAWGSP